MSLSILLSPVRGGEILRQQPGVVGDAIGTQVRSTNATGFIREDGHATL